MAILEDYPREELFQISTDDLYRTVMGVLRLAGRRQVRAVRPQGPVRAVHLVPGLPAPGPVHHREPAAHPGDPAARAERRSGSTTPPGSPTSLLARIHFIVRTDPAARSARSTPTRCRRSSPRRPGPGTTTSRTTWSASSARSRPSTCSTATRDALPDSYKDVAHADEAAQGPRQARAARRARPSWCCTCSGGARTTHDVRFKVFRYGEPMMLSAVLPVLHSPGRTGVRTSGRTRYDRADGPLYVYDFGLTLPAGRARHRRGPDQRGERLRRRLARRVRSGRVQRAGAAGRADLAPGRRSCARTRSTCARPAPCSPRSTWSRRSPRTRRSRPPGGAVRGPARPGLALADDEPRQCDALVAAIREQLDAVARRSTRTGSCARS